MDKLTQTIMDNLHTKRFIVDLSEDIDEVLKESNDSDDYKLVIDDEEWGNDF